MMSAGPPRWAAVALLLIATALLSLGLGLADAGNRSGRLLALPAGLVLAGLGLRDLLLRPVLCADADGVDVVVGLHRTRCPWSDVQRLRVVRDRRTPLLELDLGGALVVLSRQRLGRPPDMVIAELLDLHR